MSLNENFLEKINNFKSYLKYLHNELDLKADTEDLTRVATTGSYNDLTDKPTIPSDINDLSDTNGLLSSFNFSYFDNNLILHFTNVDGITLVSDKNSASTDETITLTASIEDVDGNALVDVSIDFYANDVLLDTVATDSNGEAELEYSIENDCVFVARCEEISSNNLTVTFEEPPLELTFTGITLNQGENSSSPLIGNNVTIDYGDGTIEESNGDFGHTYSEEGTYTVKIYNVTSLGTDCFLYCYGLTSINIPNTVTSIGNNCFGGCDDLTSVNIPNSVTSIGDGCFSYCIDLTNVNLPNNLTQLNDECFMGCESLTSIYIPSSVTSIGEKCFRECVRLTSISIPNTVTSIGDDGFSTTGLTSLTIPSTVTSIGGGIIIYCSDLTSVVLEWNSSEDIVTYNYWFDYDDYNDNLVFSIPYGTTSLYEAKGYPSDILVERSQGE